MKIPCANSLPKLLRKENFDADQQKVKKRPRALLGLDITVFVGRYEFSTSATVSTFDAASSAAGAVTASTAGCATGSAAAPLA